MKQDSEAMWLAMKCEIRYGVGATLSCEFPAEMRLTECQAPRGGSVDDPTNAVIESLANPVDLPPLAQAVVPGDLVAVAMEEGIPSADEVAAGVVRCLVEAGVDPKDVTVLVAPSQANLTSSIRQLSKEPEIDVVAHTPHDRQKLAYLGAADDGEPIYLNRRLCEADVVLPVNCLRFDSAQDSQNLFAGFFPAFSDQATQTRLAEQGSPKHIHPAGRAIRLLGAQFAVVVVPGDSGSILRLVSGACESIEDHCRQTFTKAWTWEVPERARLVIAALGGGAEVQTWENFGRALRAAEAVVGRDGAIVVCSELSTSPHAALLRLADWDDADAIRYELRQDQTVEASDALLLSEILEETRIYLLSDLPSDVVEALGMTPVKNEREISRLGGGFDSCILLANAQHIALKLVNE